MTLKNIEWNYKDCRTSTKIITTGRASRLINSISAAWGTPLLFKQQSDELGSRMILITKTLTDKIDTEQIFNGGHHHEAV